MKSFFLNAFIAFVAMLIPTAAFSQEAAQFSCEKLGITFSAPENCNVSIDENDAVIAITPDEEFAFTLVPFDPQTDDKDDISKAIAELMVACKLDMDHIENIDLESESFIITLRASSLGDGATAAGAILSKDSKMGFLVTITGSAKYMGYVYTSPKSIALME